MCESPAISTAAPQDLLAWYDRHARVLPWRVSPADRRAGLVPEPYHVWLSEIMLQQTTVVTVIPYFEKFLALWPRVEDLADAEDADVMAAWAGLGYYARARNLLKCAREVATRHGGQFPATEEALRGLPGIGPYTAAAVAAIAFDRSAAVMDGNVERVMARLFAVETPLPDAKPKLKTYAAELTPLERPGDYAQAVMDLGATICTPRQPACGICPWRSPCRARQEGIAERLPAKRRKPPKPLRYGTVFLARTEDGGWWLERRPDSGLLGGMLGWPGSTWEETPSEETPGPGNAVWQDLPGEVRHTFTHFHLRLALRLAVVGPDYAPPGAVQLPAEKFDPTDLPTVMRKAYALAEPWFKVRDYSAASASVNCNRAKRA